MKFHSIPWEWHKRKKCFLIVSEHHTHTFITPLHQPNRANLNFHKIIDMLSVLCYTSHGKMNRKFLILENNGFGTCVWYTQWIKSKSNSFVFSLFQSQPQMYKVSADNTSMYYMLSIVIIWTILFVYIILYIYVQCVYLPVNWVIYFVILYIKSSKI